MTDKPALQPGLAIGEALRAVARDILAVARAVMTDPALSDAKAVHDFRRQMKHWRALLRLLAPWLGEDGLRLRVQARDIARALGGARDTQSALDALDGLGGHGLALSERSLASIRQRLDGLREAAESTILTADMRLRVAATLDDAEAAVERWPLAAISFADIAGRLASGYRSARRSRPANWPEADAEHLHELRKRVVTHRYQMDLVVPLWRRFNKVWTGEAQRLRDRLGKHQDLLVLERLTGPHQPLAHWRSRLVPAIASRKAEHVAAARRIATRLLVDKPGALRRRLEAMWEVGS
jgi:CHAD domain-containing protein